MELSRGGEAASGSFVRKNEFAPAGKSPGRFALLPPSPPVPGVAVTTGVYSSYPDFLPRSGEEEEDGRGERKLPAPSNFAESL